MKLQELLEAIGMLQIDLPFDAEDRFIDEIGIQVTDHPGPDHDRQVQDYTLGLEKHLRKTYPSIKVTLLKVDGDEGMPDIRFEGSVRDINKFIVDFYCNGDEDAAADYMDYRVKI